MTNNRIGNFYEWYEVYREEGYEPEQAESMAERASRSGQLLPSWYVQPEVTVVRVVAVDDECDEEIPF